MCWPATVSWPKMGFNFGQNGILWDTAYLQGSGCESPHEQSSQEWPRFDHIIVCDVMSIKKIIMLKVLFFCLKVIGGFFTRQHESAGPSNNHHFLHSFVDHACVVINVHATEKHCTEGKLYFQTEIKVSQGEQ